MQSGARYRAVWELISEIFKDEKPADYIVNDYMRARKYIGSKDRRFITEKVWQIIRNRLKLSFDAASLDPRRILLWSERDNLDEVFDGSQYGLEVISDEEKLWLSKDNEQPYPDYVEAECPQWLFAKIKNIEFCKALNQPAEANFRAHNHSREDVLKRLESEGFDVVPTTYSPYGIKCKNRISLPNCMTYQDGWMEVQDEASQLAAILCDVKPNHKIIDYCCGAGGKSLALAYLMNNQGKILAHDISSSRLEEIKPRMQRLGIKNIELTDIIADTDRDFDRFILDAPCSGSGTWRRCPDAKFRLTPEHLQKLNQTQSELLDIAYSKTKSGGRIIYITCSIFKDENENIVEPFVKAHADLRLLNLRSLWEQKLSAPYPCHSNEYLRLSPLSTGTDGFFLAVIEKI